MKNPVAFIVPTSLKPWNARTLYRDGAGASEECLAYLARELAKTRSVSVYMGDLPEGLRETVDGVAYKPLDRAEEVPPGSTVVVSRSPTYAHPRMKETKRILWMQDLADEVMGNDLIKALWDLVVCVSPWQRDESLGAFWDADLRSRKSVVISNFLLDEHFSGGESIERRKKKLVYSSSPERGLPELLAAWPAVKRALGESAELHVCYGMQTLEGLAKVIPAWTRQAQRTHLAWSALGATDPSIIDHGRLNHADLAKLLLSCSTWVYPPYLFVETDCLSARKARAAGVVPVCPATGGLKYSAASEWTQWIPAVAATPNWMDQLIEAIVEAEKVTDSDRAILSAEAIEENCLQARMLSWEAIL